MALAHKKRIFLSSLLSVFGLLAIITSSLAWFSAIFTFKSGITGTSISNYYAGGNGTADFPFLISEARHLYNLSWLQNNGFYTQPTYFKLEKDFDMRGTLKGFNSNESGAIPPIGTDQYPFYGHFDGNGKTISNLWISSDYNDWKEKPPGAELINIGKSIGFFGNIGNETPKVNPRIGMANNFYLENVEVTSKVDTSVVGIVGGYVNGGLSKIGVKNAKISLGTTSINVRSDSSLIGQIGPNVKWIDSQAAAIGNLQIDPNSSATAFDNISANTTVKVPGSFVDTAHYIGALSVLGIDGKVGTLYKYNTVVEVDPDSTTPNNVIADTGAITAVTSKTQKLVTDAFFDRYHNNPTKTVYFNRTQPPVVSATTNKFASNNITNDNPDILNLTLSNRIIEVPANSIWFKPLNAGTSALVFLRQSQAAGNEAISVYHFLRAANNTISKFGETRFQIPKIGNKSGVYFDFKISQTMINEGYEFLISASADLSVAASTSGFLYLYLAGTDQTTGVQSADVQAVDFVYKNADNSFQNVSIENYVPKRTLLKILGTYNGAVVYNMRDVGKSPAYDGKVLFAIPSGNVVVQNPITPVDNGVGELITYSQLEFPDRIKIGPVPPP